MYVCVTDMQLDSQRERKWVREKEIESERERRQGEKKNPSNAACGVIVRLFPQSVTPPPTLCLYTPLPPVYLAKHTLCLPCFGCLTWLTLLYYMPNILYLPCLTRCYDFGSEVAVSKGCAHTSSLRPHTLVALQRKASYNSSLVKHTSSWRPHTLVAL